MVFEGPEDSYIASYLGSEFVFAQDVPRDAPAALVVELLKLNPRKLPVRREEAYEGPVAADYSQKVFRIVTEEQEEDEGGEA